jgi:hypothetical protein
VTLLPAANQGRERENERSEEREKERERERRRRVKERGEGEKDKQCLQETFRVHFTKKAQKRRQTRIF